MIDISRTWVLVKGALFDAEATWRSYLAEAGDWKRTATLITVPVIVVAMIVAYLLGLLSSGSSGFAIRPTLASTAIGIVSAIAAAGIVAFILSAFAGLFGGRRSFALGFAATSLAFVPAYAGQALSSLPFIGWLLALGLGIYGLVQLWRIIPLYLEVPAGKRARHYVVSLISMIVVFLVLGALFGGNQMRSGAGPPFGSPSSGVETNPSGSFGLIAQRAEPIAAAPKDGNRPRAS